MFTQLRIHYPTCGLVTELVAINNGQYIVRCLVQNEGTTLVTGLAAAPTVEVAEEQAKIRALTALGIVTTVNQTPETPVIAAPASLSPTATPITSTSVSTPTPVTSTSVTETPVSIPTPVTSTSVTETPVSIPTPVTSTSVTETPVSTPTPVTSTSVTETPAIPTKSDAKAKKKAQPSQLPEMPVVNEIDPAVESTVEGLPLTTAVATSVTFADEESGFPFQFDSTSIETAQSVETVDEIPQEEVVSVPKETSLTSELQEEVSPAHAVAATTPIDFSEIIARTNVQLKRLGWTNSQGRDYLVQTYGKRSRQLLTDDELLDFLHHLESVPSP